MTKNSTYYRISAILITLFIVSSCAQNNNTNSNSSETTTQPLEQIQESDQSQSPPKEPPPNDPDRIRIQDDNAQIDELRVGGQTQSIEVKPQNSMPAYEVVPRSPGNPDDPAAGRSRWRILSY